MIETIVIIALIPLDLYIFFLIGKKVFGSWDVFWKCVWHDLTPDFISFFRGRLMEDWAGEMRLGIFTILCTFVVIIEVLVYQAIF